MGHEKDITIHYFDGELPAQLTEDADGSESITVAMVSCETKGTHPRFGKLVELAVLLVEMQKEPAVALKVLDSYHGFEDPQEELSEAYIRKTGITEELVHGQKIDREKAGALLEKAEMIICYNAGSVRPFLDREFSGLENKVFACCRNQIDWPAKDFECRVLGHLTMEHGWWFDSLRSDVESAAVIKLLNELDEDTGKTYLDELVNRAQEPLIVVQADVAPRDRRLLKKERFFWDRDKGVWQRCMGTSTLARVKASLEAKGFEGELEEVETLPASDRFKFGSLA